MDGFPARLRRLRESMRPVRNVTVTSQLMGLSPDTLRKYERGEREPGLSELILIVKYYRDNGTNVSIDALAGLEKDG